MTLGLESGQVSLANAHDAWAVAFAREKAVIVAAIGEHMVAVEHIGSTAIPNVPAKPILDIMVGVDDFEDARVCVAPMETLGYEYRGENGIPRRHYFVKGDPRTHHVHMVEVGSERWRAMLRFRDLLRSRAELAMEYSREKESLARLYPRDRDRYQQEKGGVIEEILSRRQSGDDPGANPEMNL